MTQREIAFAQVIVKVAKLFSGFFCILADHNGNNLVINEQQRLFLSSLLEEYQSDQLNSNFTLDQLTELVNQKLEHGISFHLAAHQATNELILINQQNKKVTKGPKASLVITLTAVVIFIASILGYFLYQHHLSEQLPTLFPIAQQSIDHFNGQITPNTFKGVDIYVDAHSTVTATGSGEVIIIEKHPQLGSSIVIRHNNTYKTVYGNLSKVLVKEGDSVTKGEKIGESGLALISKEAKTHYAIIENEQFIDPILFMRSAISPTL